MGGDCKRSRSHEKTAESAKPTLEDTLKEINDDLNNIIDYIDKNKLKNGELEQLARPLVSAFKRARCYKLLKQALQVVLAVIGIIFVLYALRQNHWVQKLTTVFLRKFIISLLPWWNWTSIYFSDCILSNPFHVSRLRGEQDCNLALTAASPIYRGYLADVDCRWDIISASVDCRTPEERGLLPLQESRFVIPKSRYSSVDCYISECGARYNDIDLVYDKAIFQKLLDCDVDVLLARHISHLFIRDSLSLFMENVDQDDEVDMDHFENIQSTNWQTMRFKIPPVQSKIGWRVEFRPCEVQITDFENAAFGVFIVLLTRAILTFKLNMLIPISKVDENMARSQKRDAVLCERLWFRRDIFSRDCDKGDDAIEMTVDEIFNGKGDEFVGLVPLVKQYLGALDLDADTACTISQYLRLITDRARGKCLTTASWIRKFALSHPEYRNDSVVSETIAYDLLIAVAEITQGKRECPDLLGGVPKTRTSQDIPEAVKKILYGGCVELKK